MNTRNGTAAVALIFLSGCASHHGTYEPACVAFAGDSVTLDGESFVWDRSTDAIRVDASGNAINPYPNYPMHGSYTVDGGAVRMRTADGKKLDAHYLHKIAGTYRLLDADQNENWQERGQYDDCVLTLGGEDALQAR